MCQSHPVGAKKIYAALRDQILSGTFEFDAMLPSSRVLALDLGVSRSTVTLAYEQLAAEGYITARQGRRPRVSARIAADVASDPSVVTNSAQTRLSAYGERIRGAAVDVAPSGHPHVIDFRYGELAATDFPSSAWKKAIVEALTHRQDRLSYSDPRGSLRLRRALKGYLWRARSLDCEVEQIIVVNGSQQGLDLCSRLLLDPGDSFVIENPCYGMAQRVFGGTGARAIPIAVDAEGLRTDLLAGVVARLAYVTPSHQFPLGSVLSVQRRHQLLNWSQTSAALIIEDDYDSEFRYDINPVPPLHRLDTRGRTIYLGTVSKTLSPVLRLGFLIVPPHLQDVFAAAKQLTDRHAPLAGQEALATLIEAGIYETHVRKVRRLNAERRQTLLNAMRACFGDQIVIEGAEAGLHIVV